MAKGLLNSLNKQRMFDSFVTFLVNLPFYKYSSKDKLPNPVGEDFKV
jgi:hypothetical protein